MLVQYTQSGVGTQKKHYELYASKWLRLYYHSKYRVISTRPCEIVKM